MAGEPKGDVHRPSTLDPEQLGFMCGIEVHQQLATGKLHSRQSGELYDVTVDTLPENWPRFERRLRASRHCSSEYQNNQDEAKEVRLTSPHALSQNETEPLSTPNRPTPG